MLMGNFRNVDKAVYSGKNVGKRTECSESDNLSFTFGSDRIITFENLPRIVLNLFITERNLLILSVKSLYVYFNGIADFNYIRRMLNSCPRKLLDVNQTVYAAKVYKCAVRSK